MQPQKELRSISTAAQQAWETLNGLPLVSHEQQAHAWDVLRSELSAASPAPIDDVRAFASTDACDLFLSGSELAALRVFVAWLSANVRAGRMPELHAHSALAEVVVAQLGSAPWESVWEAAFLDRDTQGGTLWLDPQIEAPALEYLLYTMLKQAPVLCPGWPSAARARLIALLCDVWYWLHTMLLVFDDERVA